MADPRNYTKRTGVAPEVHTYQIDSATLVYDALSGGGHARAGDIAVTLSGNGIVAACADADDVLGNLLKIESDGMCAVLVDGVTTLPAGLAATVTAGSKIVGALGAAAAKGYIRNAAYATLAEVAKARGRILDASVATAVEVDL